MRVSSITTKLDNKYVESTLLWDIALTYWMGQEVPLNLTVTVQTEDDRTLGVARQSTLGIGDVALEAAAKLKNNNAEQTSTRQAMLPISAKQLDHLEDVRTKNRKRDVILLCHVDVQFLVSAVVNAYLQPGPKIADQNGNSFQSVIYDWQSQPFKTDHGTMWILSGDRNPTFLRCETRRFSEKITISASDWVYEYLEPWRATRYMLVELPQPEVLTSAPNIEEKVNAAIEAAKRASESLCKGEWNDVIKELRQVWEVIRDGDVDALLQDDGYTAEAATLFNASIRSQFDLASKFIHIKDKSGKKVLPEIRASKEDAYFCYAFALAALNLLTKKSIRRSKAFSPE
jgi:hypothetical protein